MRRPRLWVVEVKWPEGWFALGYTATAYRDIARCHAHDARTKEPIYEYRTVPYERVEPKRVRRTEK